ncbi:MAG TPA: AAA family ATPase, partial [Thermomicrobiaceae bacterium]|nr:AAA family ATPase [Thermomicrobiaceae bacterium]
MTADHASPYLFVSYASRDRERVLPVVERLEAAGVTTWVDREGIHGGANYALEIAEAIEHAEALLLMCSDASLASRNVKQELALAWRFEKPYLPLLLDPVEIPKDVAYWLEGAQWIELLERSEHEWLADVALALAPLGITLQRPPATVSAERRERPLLVGREREQGSLRQQLDQMLGGHGGVVLVGGEVGIGKSTLVEDLSVQAEEAGALVLWGHAYDLSVTPPYGPWLEIFRAYQPLSQGLPPVPAFVGDADELAHVGSQESLFAAMRDFFTALAAQRPLVLVLDDLHWADQASLDFFRVLARQAADQRSFLIATYRSDELGHRHPLAPLLPLLVRESGAVRLDVRSLDATDYRALIQSRYALRADDQTRLERYLMRRAEGNPLYAGEVLRTLEEEGVLVARDGAWRLGDLAQARVPTLLRQVIEGRVGRFDEEHRLLLAIAAVVGQTVPLDVWAEAGEVDEDAVLDLAERAEEARLLEGTPEGTGVQFRHALIRETLYEGIPTIRRRRLHRRVGEILAARPTPDPDVVADHFIRAADPRAADWLVKAGERAEQAYDWQAAVKRLEQAIGILEGNAQRRGEVARLLYQMGNLDRYGDPGRSVSYLDRAERLARESGDEGLALMAEFSRAFKRCYLGDVRGGLDDAARVLQRIDLAHQAPEPVPDAIARFEATRGIDGIWGVYAQWLAQIGRIAEALRCIDEH